VTHRGKAFPFMKLMNKPEACVYVCYSFVVVPKLAWKPELVCVCGYICPHVCIYLCTYLRILDCSISAQLPFYIVTVET
jgi:hypothetical protein